MGNSFCSCNSKDSQDILLQREKIEFNEYFDNTVKSISNISALDIWKLIKIQRHIIRRLALIRANKLNKPELPERITTLGSNFNANKNEEQINYNYVGEMRNGVKVGFGIQSWNDGAIYKGCFLNNKANQLGKFIHSDGDVYDGEFQDDRASGFGIYVHQNGAMYTGEWTDDTQNGIGIELMPDRSNYEGNYLDGKKFGIGTYAWADGGRYEGEWLDNSLHGFGKYIFTDKRVYIGQWQNNTMKGYGELYFDNGRVYKGFHDKDKKDGFGLFYWPEPKNIYIGFWRNGKQSGLGRFLTSKNSKWGSWKDGKIVTWFKSKEEAYQTTRANKSKYEKLFDMNLKDSLEFLEASEEANSIIYK